MQAGLGLVEDEQLGRARAQESGGQVEVAQGSVGQLMTCHRSAEPWLLEMDGKGRGVAHDAEP